MKKICVVTGTRSEYGLLYWLIKDLNIHPEFEMQIIATGMHLSPEYGLTYKVIEDDGFFINDKIEMLLSSDTPIGISKSVGLATISFSESYSRLNPDLIIILGDRYEMLAAVQSALFMKIPIAHIGGGDTTEGAFDESIRHAITKMSHIHFATNDIAKQRIIQMGENSNLVYNFGNPGIDHIKRTNFMERLEFERSINFKLLPKNLLVTYHPTTLNDNSFQQFKELLSFLNDLPENEFGIIITKPNSDTGGREISYELENFSKLKKNVTLHTSLGQIRYLSALNYVDIIVGNSSSGLTEAPSFNIPTLNIGDRQKGRLSGTSVINSEFGKESIEKGFYEALNIKKINISNPYGDGNTTGKIIKVLSSIQDYKSLLAKKFYEIEGGKYEE